MNGLDWTVVFMGGLWQSASIIWGLNYENITLVGLKSSRDYFSKTTTWFCRYTWGVAKFTSKNIVDIPVFLDYLGDEWKICEIIENIVARMPITKHYNKNWISGVQNDLSISTTIFPIHNTQVNEIILWVYCIHWIIKGVVRGPCIIFISSNHVIGGIKDF